MSASLKVNWHHISLKTKKMTHSYLLQISLKFSSGSSSGSVGLGVSLLGVSDP